MAPIPRVCVYVPLLAHLQKYCNPAFLAWLKTVVSFLRQNILIFSRGHATLELAVSVCLSVGWSRELGLEAGIWALRLGFGPRGWNVGLEDEI